MKKILLTMTALTALAAAAPAAAQSGYQPNLNARGAVSIDQRIDRLEARLEAGIRSGAISQTDAARLRVQISQLEDLERAYSRNGITQQEHAALQQRLRSVRQQIRTADRGAFDRYEQSGEWAEDDQWGNPTGYAAMDFDDRIVQLSTRLDAGIRSGAIDRWQANGLRQQLNQLSQLERQYSRNGLTAQEQAALQQRVASVRQQIRTADRGSYDRYEQAGMWAEYDQFGNTGGYGAIDLDDRIVQLSTRLDAGIRSGAIDRWRANSLRQQLNQLSQLERQYSRNGLTAQEHADLQQRVRSLRQQIRTADRGSYDRYEQAGVWAEYDDYMGQGGVYQDAEYCERRSGIGGLLDNILGRDDDACGLQVGQRVTGNLSPVPYAYRNQFRDGNGVYYRSDGQQIYQIDARTQTVVRVYPMNR